MDGIIALAKYPFLLSLIMLWSLFWKGNALWHAARRRHLTWFILLLVVNTMGLLEIAYLYYLHKYDLGSQKLLKKLGELKLHK